MFTHSFCNNVLTERVLLLSFYFSINAVTFVTKSGFGKWGVSLTWDQA